MHKSPEMIIEDASLLLQASEEDGLIQAPVVQEFRICRAVMHATAVYVDRRMSLKPVASPALKQLGDLLHQIDVAAIERAIEELETGTTPSKAPSGAAEKLF